VIEGKYYKDNYISVFGDNSKPDKNIVFLDSLYDPYNRLEKSREIEELDYNSINLFKYFENYNSFLSALDNKSNQHEIENIETFIKCLCKIYIGNSIHQRINDEISKKTNLRILKGDYFISLGYKTVAALGNPLVIRFYSKIAENFAKVIYY
jgi:hypothetical protein